MFGFSIVSELSEIMRCEKKGVFSLTGKNFLKGVGTYFFAEILCLFLALTLSAVGGAVTRVISAVCTAAVLICLCINFAVNRGKEDKKREIPNRIGRRFFGASVYLRCFCCLVFVCCCHGVRFCRMGSIAGTRFSMRRFCSCAIFSVEM